MSQFFRKIVAVSMLLWLPLSSASALAATVFMQAQHGACHEAVVQETPHADAGEHRHHGDVSAQQAQTVDDKQGGHSCEVCHLACSGYLAVPIISAPAIQAVAPSATPYVASFHSVTSAPLLPPPLVRA